MELGMQTRRQEFASFFVGFRFFIRENRRWKSPYFSWENPCSAGEDVFANKTNPLI